MWVDFCWSLWDIFEFVECAIRKSINLLLRSKITRNSRYKPMKSTCIIKDDRFSDKKQNIFVVNVAYLFLLNFTAFGKCELILILIFYHFRMLLQMAVNSVIHFSNHFVPQNYTMSKLMCNKLNLQSSRLRFRQKPILFLQTRFLFFSY